MKGRIVKVNLMKDIYNNVILDELMNTESLPRLVCLLLKLFFSIGYFIHWIRGQDFNIQGSYVSILHEPSIEISWIEHDY